MKNSILKKYIAILTMVLVTNVFIYAQTETGLPGDHFSLEGAVEMFKNAKDLEAFEKAINQENNFVNNLDLNADGDIDYIRVEDHTEEGIHAIVLQAVISKDELQDIAVIEIEQNGNKSALLQIVGDEDVFGENVIVEPFDETGAGTDRKGPSYEEETVRVVVNVWLWPSVRTIYSPRYRAWKSPWRWGYYPVWWSPWRSRPFAWHYNKRAHYHVGFHAVHTHRVVNAHRIYSPHRSASVAVRKAHSVSLDKYRNNSGVQKKGAISQSTKTKVVQGPNGGKVAVSKKTTSGVAKNSNGKKVAGSKSSTKVVGKKANGTKVAGKKSTKSVGATNGKKKMAGKKNSTSKAKVSGNKKMATKKTKSKKAVGKKKN